MGSNTLAIKSNFEIAKEHNLLIEKRLDMLAKQEKDHNDLIEAKQDLLAKQEKEHNEIIEAKLDMLANREKEACNPPNPIVQSLAIDNIDDSNTVLKQQSSSVDMDTDTQLKPTMEDTLVSNIPINSTPIVSPITKVMGSEKTVSNSLDSVSQIPKLKVNKSRRRKKQLKRKAKMLPVYEQVKDESLSNIRIFLEEMFKFLIALMNAVTSIMNSPTGILWGLVFLLALHPQFIQASPVHSGDINSHSSLDTLLNNFQTEKSFTIYALESYDASSFTFPLKEVKLEEFNGLDDACSGISAQHELCLNQPGSCQTSRITANNFEETIKIHTRSLVDLN